MSIAGMVIGGLLALVFLLDLVLGVPFNAPAGAMVNIGFAICGGVLAYLGWSAFRETR